ncbi:MAG: AraC family transcriptional regulator [Sphaerochaeta sp.]|jgi:AraC-like DNA-binding protein|nr:AraC family transcriptional regulator [Spirochaetales bacterium]
MDVRITSSGRFYYREGTGMEEHLHQNDWQIQLVYSGSATTWLNGKEYELESGDIAFCKMGWRHAFTSTSSDGVKMLEVKFTTADSITEELLKGIETKFRDREGQIYALLSHIVLEGQRKQIHYKTMSSSLLTECLVVMRRLCLEHSLPIYESNPVHQSRRSASGQSNVVLDAVDAYINSNMGTSFTLSEMASQCGYNQDYLYRVIKRQTGLSLIKYVNLVKFEHALAMIQNTDLTLSEIGWNLGFENLQYFSRFFKQHGGIAPSLYIEKVRRTTRTDY